MFSFTSAADFSLNLPCGQVVALVGHSGGGKSTVAHLIEGFYRPTGGNILLDGVDITQFEPRQLRRIIGIVTQEPTLFGCSIAENISYGADAADFPTPEALRQAVVSAAKLAHAHEFICDFPQQYDTLVGERGVRLSGGQKQRIAIARALLIGSLCLCPLAIVLSVFISFVCIIRSKDFTSR